MLSSKYFNQRYFLTLVLTPRFRINHAEETMLTIGKVATSAAVTTDTIRHYEKEGLLAPLQKTAAGYRLYSADTLGRLRFIKQAQQCCFSLTEIR